MNAKFKRGVDGLELVITAISSEERALMNELILDRRMRKLKAPKIRVDVALNGDNVANISIKQKVYVTPEILGLYGFEKIIGGTDSYLKKTVGTYTYLLYGTGAYHFLKVYNSNFELMCNINQKTFYLRNPDNVTTRIYFPLKSKTIFRTTGELDYLLKNANEIEFTDGLEIATI